MNFYKQSESTAARRWILFRCFDDDSADGYAPKTGLTFSSGELKIAKPGVAYANATGYASVVEAGFGGYWYPATAAELDTLGVCALVVNKTDVYAADVEFQVVPWDPYDVTGLGLTNLDATVSSNSPENAAAGLLDLADSIETGLTVRQALRAILAGAIGKISGAGTSTVSARAAVSDTKVRVTATVDAVGNRTSVSSDLS